MSSKTQFHFYGKNQYFMNSEVNKAFEEVLAMSDSEFEQWIKDVRAKIVEVWDVHGIPPVNGYTEQEILEQFNLLHCHEVHKMFVKDELTGDTCIRNTHNKLGNACNSWFPTMMKTRINYGRGEARSIYDYMARDDLLKNYMPYGRRHFKRDSFYAYSQCITIKDTLPHFPTVAIKDSLDWIFKFEKYERLYGEYDYWLQEKEQDTEYTGYNEELIGKEFLSLTANDIKNLNIKLYNPLALSNIDELQENKKYLIRFFKKGQKIFPVGLKSFRISVCQYAVNFPPVIAKAMWEKYTEEFKSDEKVYIWDPSCGWGGRLLGALSCRDDRNIVYLGCDPNTDHTIDFLQAPENPPYTKYDDLATFYTTKSVRAYALFPHTNEWKIWQCGSEELQNEQEFQQYKGKLSCVFTSPPYFHREVYSEDATQSCHKFAAYEAWRDTFLYETLKTAYEWLRPGGYICWNIADIKEGNDFVPLEKDSCEIMEKLGFEKVEVLKLVLGQMPGGNRTTTDDEGNILSTNKNSVRIEGRYYRFEPIFVYRKPV